MKVVHIVDDPALGGINRLLQDLLPKLGEWRQEKIVLSTTYSVAPRLEADIAVVHFTASWAKLPFLASLRWRFRGKPIVLVEHSYTAGYETSCVTNRPRFRRMLRLAYGLCDRVVAVSRTQGAWMVEAGLLAPSRLTVIPPSLDLTKLARLAPPTAHAGPLRLAAYGRYAPQKGFETLIAAVRLLPSERVTLTLAGYGPLEAELKALAAGAANIHVGGPIADPAAFLADADAIAIPSRWEAYGLVAAEARMAARPVIASAVDGLVDQIGGMSGLLVPPDDPRRLADAIVALGTADLAAMGIAGRRSAWTEWQLLIAGWRSLLAQLAAQSEKSRGFGARAGFQFGETPCQIAKTQRSQSGTATTSNQ